MACCFLQFAFYGNFEIDAIKSAFVYCCIACRSFDMLVLGMSELECIKSYFALLVLGFFYK